MKLQILIPQYNETEEVIKPLLDSIALQQNVDFSEIGAIIVNDGSDIHLSREFLDSYPYLIEYYLEEHRGVSATRNSCLNKAVADYVMFCDADDMFLSVCGLYNVFLDINEGFDTLTSSFVEETRDRTTRAIVYITHDFDATFIHGKVHRRLYLIENNIRFKDELTVNEDSYFTVLCQSLTDKHKHCKLPFYLWRWRDDSVCRADPEHRLKTFTAMIDANDYLVDELASRGQTQKSVSFVLYMIIETFYTINKQMWLSNNVYRAKVEERIARYIRKHHAAWDSAPYADKVNMAHQLRERAMNEGMGIEVIALDQWLTYLKEMSWQQDE